MITTHKKMRTTQTSWTIIVIFIGTISVQRAQELLSYNYYEKSCPQLENIIRVGLAPIFSTDLTSSAAFLRLMFHDCQVQGCDASILVDPSNKDVALEMASSRNFGVRKREAINLLKAVVEDACPGTVSCADILILVARESVAVAGGPHIEVPLGRRDSSSGASYESANSLLPSPAIGVDGMLRVFADKGMSLEESVAIMGAHTLGITHCLNMLDRLYKPQKNGITSKGLAPSFEALLRLTCPQVSLNNNSSFVLNDPTTLAFDNLYYHNSMRGHGLLRVDAELAIDHRTANLVRRFADDQAAFFRAFSSAFVKLSSHGVLVGNKGGIRKMCNVV